MTTEHDKEELLGMLAELDAGTLAPAEALDLAHLLVTLAHRAVGQALDASPRVGPVRDMNHRLMGPLGEAAAALAEAMTK